MSERDPLVDIVQSVSIFPLKSGHEATLNGEPITELEVGPTGLQAGGVADREWVIADSDNLFVSQRGWDDKQARKHHEDRLLATVRVDIRHDHLHLWMPGYGEAQVPFEQPQGPEREVRIFGPNLPVIEEGENLAEYFSQLLGRAVYLARADKHRPRWLPEKYQRAGAANRSAAADGRPVSLASQESLNHLHELAGVELGSVALSTFRANINIVGKVFGRWGEDRLLTVTTGEMAGEVVKPLPRCVMITIDQENGDDAQRQVTHLLMPRMGWPRGEDMTKKAELLFAQGINHYFDLEVPQFVRVNDPVTGVMSEEPNTVLKRNLR